MVLATKKAKSQKMAVFRDNIWRSLALGLDLHDVS